MARRQAVDDSRSLAQPHPDRLTPYHPRRGEILAAHSAAMAAGQAGYLDPDTGLFVLTAAHLAGRETCCTRGCRHCPYIRLDGRPVLDQGRAPS